MSTKRLLLKAILTLNSSLTRVSVVFTIAGIVVYVYFELQQADNEDKVTTTFGYSLYTSCGAGAASFLASMIAFAGS